MTHEKRTPKSIALIGGSAVLGGTEVFNRRLTGMLEKDGHRVETLKLHSHRGAQSKPLHLAKLIITALRALAYVVTQRPERIVVSAANIIDVLAAHMIARLTMRRDILLVCHFNSSWRFWSMPRMVRLFARASRRLRVFCIAANQKTFFEAQGIDVEEEIFPNFLNFTPAQRAARPTRTDSSPIVVLYAGRIVPEKRIAELAQFLSALTDETFALQLRLVGKSDPKYITEIAAHIRPHFEVVFLGQTGEQGVSAAMSQADIFASFSTSDTLPLNMLEAATHGLPILAPRTEVTKDVAALTDQVIFIEEDASIEACRALVRDTLNLPHSPSARTLIAANEARAFHLLDLSAPSA